MKKIGKLLAIALVLVFAAGILASCGGNNGPAPPATPEPPTSPDSGQENSSDPVQGSSNDDDTKFTVGVVISKWADPYHASVMYAIRKYVQEVVAPEHGDRFTFLYENSAGNVENQWTHVENLINNGADAIIIFAVNSSDGATLMDMSNNNGIPMIAVTRALDNGYEFAAYSISDNIEAGEMCARAALEALDGRDARVAVILGRPANIATTDRTQGYRNVLDGVPNVEFVAEEYGEFDRSIGMNVVETWIQAGIDFNVILSNNDEMAIGASFALAAAGIEDVLITGVDGTVDGIQAVKDGVTTATAMQNGIEQGQSAVRQTIYILLGQPWDSSVPQFANIDFTLITSENVSEFENYWDEIIAFQASN